MKSAFRPPSAELDMEPLSRSTSCSPQPPSGLPRIILPDCGDSPSMAKRRRMNCDTPSSVGSTCDSPIQFSGLDLSISPSFEDLGNRNFESLSNRTFDELSFTTDSNVSSPGESPTTFRPQDLKGRYKKDELWAAIQSDYQYLMNKEIIETCKSTESDLSWEDDDLGSNTKVSFAEFMQQYKELTDWLNQIQQGTQAQYRRRSSLSEKYLNQSYHEEMLQRSPRRKLFNDYAKQLMRRYPSMKEEITARLSHVNNQWEALEKAICPSQAYQDQENMLKDLEEDLNGLRKWLHDMENQVQPLFLHLEWTPEQLEPEELETKLREHKVLQRDIESHSKIVSAVLKLCERLQGDEQACSTDGERESLQLVAVNLERRWHAIWLKSLEWQCRLEEAISNPKGGSAKIATCQPPGWRGFGFTPSTSHHIDIPGSGQEGRDRLDYPHHFDDGLDSDHSNSDIIPFYESEYEKITVDTDTQTDECEGKRSPKALKRAEKCDSLDQGIDSALGRSVSDHSINADPQAVYHAAIQITSEQVGKAVRKAANYRSYLEVEMRASEPPCELVPMRGKRSGSKLDVHDIGYSSESHSNDEPDGVTQPLENARKLANGEGAYAASHVSTPEEATTTGDMLRWWRNAGINVDGKDGAMQKVANPATWRHSMTSAYDTSSNCSDGNSPQELDTSETGATTVEDQNRVNRIISSPSQEFYKMTVNETDSELSNAERKSKVVCNGAANGYSSENEPVQKDLGRDKISRCKAKTRLDLICNDMGFRMEKMERSYGRDAGGASGVGADSNCEIGASSGYTDICVQHEDMAVYSADRKSGKSDSLIVEGDPDTTIGMLSSDDVQGDESSTEKPKEASESIRRLIRQAELLVMDEQLMQLHKAKELQRRRKRAKARMLDDNQSDGLLSTDGSAVPTEEDSHRSSCDASGEYTTGSESDEDFSTASSDPGEGYDNTVSSNQSFGGITLSSSVGGCPHGTLPRRNKRRSDRPNSVTEMYELSNRLDLSPFSISESAINSLPQKTHQKLRRTTSDTYSLTHTQRRMKKRRSKRDGRKSPVGTVQPKVVHSTPVQLPRSPQKSWYSQSAPCGEQPHSASESNTAKIVSDSGLRRKLICECTPAERMRGVPALDVTTEQDLAERLLVGSDTDAMVHSVHSAVESFSEQAWDNYQDPPYTHISDDPTEEKLDDSSLQWDHGLEFEDDFEFDTQYAPDRTSQRSPDKSRSVKDRRNTLVNDASQADDSDSDLEDLHHVIKESQQQILLAESVLKKHRKDVMDTGIHLDPSEYAELLATCQTNIRCLEVVSEHLDAEDSVANVTVEDINKVEEIIDQWSILEAQAHKRLEQSRELLVIHRDLMALQASVQDVTDQLELNSFDDVDDLEHTIKAIQEGRLEVEEQRSRLETLEDQVDNFSERWPDVHMATVQQTLTLLGNKMGTLPARCVSHASDLQSVLISWYDFNETGKELLYLLQQERYQLGCLTLAKDVVTFSQQDLLDTVMDLQAMKPEFDVYEAKLKSMQELSSDILVACDEHASKQLRSKMAAAEHELTTVKNTSQLLIGQFQERLASQKLGEVKMEEEMSLEDVEVQTILAAAEQLQAQNRNIQESQPCRPRSALKRIMKTAVPVQLAVILAFGMLCWVDPTYLESLSQFGFVINPDLQYVRGPPPT